jgi:iron(III) transport system permease protein
VERGRLNTPRSSRWCPAPWLAGGLLIVFIAGALPLAWLAMVALGAIATSGVGLASPRTAALFGNTVRLGIAVAGLVGILGTTFGMLSTKTDLPGRRVLLGLLTFPLFLPPYILALGWFTVLGRHGLVSAVAGRTAGIWASEMFFGLGGAVLVLTVAYTPIVMHLVRVGLRSIDPAAEESARLRFRWLRILWRIDLPLVAPAIALGMLVTFILVIGEFGVQAYLRYPVSSGAVFTEFAAFLNIRAAVVASIPLMLLVLAGLGAERYWLRAPAPSLARVRLTPLVAPLAAWRLPVALGGWAYALVTVVLPLAGLAREAGGWESYRAAARAAASSIVVSVGTAAAAATVILATALMVSYLVERSGSTRRHTVDTALLLLFAAPGTVLGVSLIVFWNRPGLTGIYTSVAILLIAYVAHYTPVAARAVGIALQSISPTVEHAARLAGVPWITMVRRVLLPSLAPALAGVWGLTFILCLRDLDLAMTVHPPGVETLPIRVYTLMANSSSSVTAELVLLIVALTLAVMLVAGVAMAVARRVSAWS